MENGRERIEAEQHIEIHRVFHVSHLVHLFVPRQVRGHVHGQPVGPSHERHAIGVSTRRDLLHSRNEVVHMLVHDGLQSPQGPSAERRGDLSGHAAMLDRIFFPYQAAEVLAAILEVGLDEVLEILVLRRVDVAEGLGREERELVGRDPHDRPVLVQCLLDRPGPPSGEPVVRIPEVGDSGKSWPWEPGQRMEVQQVDNTR